jgi:hypothetical protein
VGLSDSSLLAALLGQLLALCLARGRRGSATRDVNGRATVARTPPLAACAPPGLALD